MLASAVKLLVLGWLMCSTFMAAIVLADELSDGREQSISIPAGDLTTSLELLAKQTGAEFVYDADQLKGITTRGVSGNITPKAAVLKLLEGTNLTLTEHKSGAILIAAPQDGVHRISTSTPTAASEREGSAHLAQSSRAVTRSDPDSNSVTNSSTVANSEKPRLDEIVVTARRREENINSVPVAITALTAADLRSKNVETAADLQNYVPSLSVSSSGPTRDDYTFAIRGMGPTGGSGPGAVLGGGGTGVVAYFAEVPTTAAGPGLFFDLESVQVAEGPQGTLFGKNTTGGVILFVPRKPTNEFGGFIEAGGGDYNMRSSTAVLNVPVIDDLLLVRFSAQFQQRSGFTIDRGPFYPGKDYDNRDFWAARLSVVFRPTESFENYMIVSALHSDEHGDGFVLSAVNPGGPFATQLLPIFAQQQAAGIRSTSLSDDEIDKRYNYGIIDTTRWSPFQSSGWWKGYEHTLARLHWSSDATRPLGSTNVGHIRVHPG